MLVITGANRDELRAELLSVCTSEHASRLRLPGSAGLCSPGPSEHYGRTRPLQMGAVTRPTTLFSLPIYFRYSHHTPSPPSTGCAAPLSASTLDPRVCIFVF